MNSTYGLEKIKMSGDPVFQGGGEISWSTVVLIYRDGSKKNGCPIAYVQNDMFKSLR